MTSSDSIKRCGTCGEWKPHSEFHRRRASADGLNNKCKPCARAAASAHYHTNKVLKPTPEYPDGHKPCTRCGQMKPLSEFYKRAAVRLGVTSHCKTCHSAASVVRMKRWIKANPEQHWLHQERYRKRNRATIQKRNREWGERNRDQIRSSWRNRDAAFRNAEGTHTADEVLKMYDDQGGLCAYCETPLFGDFQVDHMVPISQGGRNDWPNLAITCPLCNQRKGKRPLVEFLQRYPSL